MVAGLEHARFEEVLDRGIIGRGTVPAHAPDQVVTLEEHPQGAVGAGREPGEIADNDFLGAGGVIAPAFPQRVDGVSIGPRCAMGQRNVDWPVRLAFFEDVVQPERPRAMQVTHAGGNEAHVDILDEIVAGGDVQTLDATAAIFAVVEVDIHGVDRIAAQDRGHRKAVTLVDGRLGSPECGNGAPAVPHVCKRPGHDLANQALPPVFGQRTHGGDTSDEQCGAVCPHGERDGGEARYESVSLERTKRPFGSRGGGDEIVWPVAVRAAVDIAGEQAELSHLLCGCGSEFDVHYGASFPATRFPPRRPAGGPGGSPGPAHANER